MTRESLAGLLNGRDVRAPLTSLEIEQAKKDGLVVVYGYSDDLMELEGAISDEGGCYDGGEFLIDKEGILPSFEEVCDREDEVEMEQYILRKRKAHKIVALWCMEEEFSWAYKTNIPHSTFILKDENNNDEKSCKGIVFYIDNLN